MLACLLPYISNYLFYEFDECSIQSNSKNQNKKKKIQRSHLFAWMAKNYSTCRRFYALSAVSTNLIVKATITHTRARSRTLSPNHHKKHFKAFVCQLHVTNCQWSNFASHGFRPVLSVSVHSKCSINWSYSYMRTHAKGGKNKAKETKKQS